MFHIKEGFQLFRLQSKCNASVEQVGWIESTGRHKYCQHGTVSDRLSICLSVCLFIPLYLNAHLLARPSVCVLPSSPVITYASVSSSHYILQVWKCIQMDHLQSYEFTYSSSVSLSWQLLQTRTGNSNPNFGSGDEFFEQESHTAQPHWRQWCYKGQEEKTKQIIVGNTTHCKPLYLFLNDTLWYFVAHDQINANVIELSETTHKVSACSCTAEH